MASSKNFIVIVLIVCLSFSVFLFIPKKAHAYGMDVVFKDTGFGFLIGIGMAALLMAANPNTQSDDWGRGMAVGGVCGAGIGLAIGFTSTYKTALIDLDSEKGLAFNRPTLTPDLSTCKTSVSLLKYRF